MGIDVVVRQTFLEASYALIDSDFNPLPDYWLTLLYKRLVGGKVLNTTLHQCKGDNCTLYDRSKVRIYAHCAKNKYRKGSIVIYFINLWSRKLHLALQPFAGLTGQGYLYLLEPSPPGNLTSKSIRLNGVTLKLSSTNTFPRLRPTRIDESKLKLGIKIPSFTYGFLVLSGANAPACINNGI
uniref:Heparanase-like n=1 Tax=Ciona intestinalis TaxID=7719 RepID=H2Y2Y8_CIOIN|nr:heparanase-like [Ciona intestinalis]|eukprot:XP_002125979.2 heparanase-like [Ciona intestinalis]